MSLFWVEPIIFTDAWKMQELYYFSEINMKMLRFSYSFVVYSVKFYFVTFYFVIEIRKIFI